MKLADLHADLASIASQLEAKYGTKVTVGLSVNPEDLGQIVMSLGIRTAPEASKTEAAAAIASTEVANGSSESQEAISGS